jgi:hypothetical protein
MAGEEGDAQYAAHAETTDEVNVENETLEADVTTPISPEIKSAVAEEVGQEIAYDNAAASGSPQKTSYDELPAVLGKPNHVFIVSAALDVTTADQEGCGLQPGDTLQLISPPANDAAIVQLRVGSSKRTDCPAGVMVSIALQDLQEMRNNFRSQIESGLGTLLTIQGRNGIPVAPPESVAAPPRPALSEVPPVPASELTTMLAAQRKQADQAETQVVAEAFSDAKPF